MNYLHSRRKEEKLKIMNPKADVHGYCFWFCSGTCENQCEGTCEGGCAQICAADCSIYCAARCENACGYCDNNCLMQYLQAPMSIDI